MHKKFKTSVFLFLVLLLNISVASAQIRIGVKGGYDVADHKIKSDILESKNRMGYQIGPTLEFIAPVSGFGVEVSALYGHQEYKVTSTTPGVEISDYNYLYIPVNLKKRFSLLDQLGVFGYVGPYAQVKLSGGDLDFDQIGDDLKSKSFQAGINVGFGVSLFRNFDVGMAFRYKLTDDYSTDRPEWKDVTKVSDKTWTTYLSFFF